MQRMVCIFIILFRLLLCRILIVRDRQSIKNLFISYVYEFVKDSNDYPTKGEWRYKMAIIRLPHSEMDACKWGLHPARDANDILTTDTAPPCSNWWPFPTPFSFVLSTACQRNCLNCSIILNCLLGRNYLSYAPFRVKFFMKVLRFIDIVITKHWNRISCKYGPKLGAIFLWIYN